MDVTAFMYKMKRSFHLQIDWYYALFINKPIKGFLPKFLEYLLEHKCVVSKYLVWNQMVCFSCFLFSSRVVMLMCGWPISSHDSMQSGMGDWTKLFAFLWFIFRWGELCAITRKYNNSPWYFKSETMSQVFTVDRDKCLQDV